MIARPKELAGSMLRGLLEFLLPPVCAGCGAHLHETDHISDHVFERACERAPEIESVLCGPCSRALQFLNREGCLLCQLPTPSRPHRLCSRCKGEGSSLDACTARVAFEGRAEGWIRDFKYPRSGIAGLLPGPESIVVALARDVSQMLVHRSPDLVVPVPLHPSRLRARGFNPATTLARAIAKQVGGRLTTDLLIRLRDTPSQTHLGRRQRRSNIRDAFACTAVSAPDIWLVDDVVTTRSTLEEAARCLRRAGAKNIQAICAARTL
ncbi:MAG: ComF family protein [Myxococcales bacterium]|nr:ComF family protein [Myxococcales bacterium]